MNKNFGARLGKEAKALTTQHADTLALEIIDEAKNIWHINFVMPANTVFAGEKYTLQFKFDSSYPFEPPQVMFVGQIPHHEHVYKCGYICLSTLSTDWTPALQTSQVCLSIISMLGSATEKKRPPNDDSASAYMQRIGNPKKVTWVFEDDKC